MEPIRILQYGLSGGLAGIENVVMDLYRNIDRDKIQFDFLMMHDEDPYFADEITALGGRIYKVIYQRGKNPIRGSTWNYNFFSNHNEFAAIHCNVSSLLAIDRILTPIVRKTIPQRIIHVHNTGEGKEAARQLQQLDRLRNKLSTMATDLVACSEFAGRYSFGKAPFRSVPNAIKTEKYLFDEQLRQKTRKRLCITNEKVIGVVGSLRYQKNHEFLLRIFAEVLSKDPTYLLMIVGNGVLEDALKKQACELGIDSRIIWVGEQQDTRPFYCAMDQYVMPSRYEGYGLVYLEAQACGLPCIGTDKRVPEEVNVTGLVTFIALDWTPDKWADKVVSQPIRSVEERYKTGADIGQYRCDVQDYARTFEKIYLEGIAQ